MKKLMAMAMMAVIAPSMAAGTTWTLQGRDYSVDTVFHAKIGPGTTQTSLQLGGAQNLRIVYTTTDLTNPYADIRVVKAGNIYARGAALSTQQKQADAPGARHFAGVNADFFAGSAPCGSTVINGEVYNATPNNWVNWYMTADRKQHIGTLGYHGTCHFPDGSTHGINGINVFRDVNYLNIFTTRMNGATSGTNPYGTEVGIVPVDGSLAFSGKGRYRVTSAPASAGNMAIPAGGYVLSGNGTGANKVSSLKIGDEIELDLYPELNGTSITQMASGMPAILSEGVTLETQGALDHLVALNPRTAIGYNADGTKVVLLVVDGRTAGSSGVVSKVLADIMREVGCTEAMNFDGGGSSELYTSMFGVRNHPSDGSERAVTNSVWCVSTAPDDNTVAEIRFTAEAITLPKYGRYVPQFYAYNQYGYMLSTDLQGATLSCPEELGVVSDDGTMLLASGSGTHMLTASYNGVTAKVPVTIGSGAPKMRLSQVVVDGYRDYTVEVTATVGDLEMPLDNVALTWESDNPEVVAVDSEGVIHGIKSGTANVIATVDDFRGVLPVIVDKPATRHIAVVPDENTTISKTSVKSAEIPVLGQESFVVNYTLSSTRAPKLTLSFKKPMAAMPDSVGVTFCPVGAEVSAISFSVAPAGSRSVVSTVNGPFAADKYSTVMLPVSDFLDVDDFANYPVELTNIGFSLGGTTGQQRSIEVKSLYGVHTAVPVGQGGAEDIIADDASNAGDIRYYDLQGRAVANPAAGVYIRRCGSHVEKVVIR